MTTYKKISSVAAALIAVLGTSSAMAVDWHGYLRSGVGGSEDGDQSCFQLNGAATKYRLGNECENYAEMAFSQELFSDDNKVSFELHTRMAYVVSGHGDWEPMNTTISVSGEAEQINFNAGPSFRENFAVAKNVFGAGEKFWVGKRFYRRHDVHMTDFYWWANTGTGGGVEDIPVGDTAKAAVAWIRNSDNDGNSVDNLDIRFYGIETNANGNLTVGFNLASADPRDDGDTSGNDQDGWALTLVHQQNDLWGGFNKVAFQYGDSAMAGNPGGGGNTGAGDDDKSWRIIEQMVVQPNNDFSGMFTLVYQDSEINNSEQKWFSIGVRPQYHINEYVSIALEVGHDEVDPENGDKAKLDKITLAPQISAGRSFWARPALRAFVTYASWNEAAGDAGTGGAFGDDDSGMTYGIQTEVWW